MTKDEQLRVFRRDLHLARNRVAAMLTPDQEIDDLALARLEAGYDQFGDEGWHKTPYELKQDIREELADALVYVVMLMRAERELVRQVQVAR